MEHIAELGGILTGFNVTESYIDCVCGKELLKIVNTLEILFTKIRYLRKKVCQEN